MSGAKGLEDYDKEARTKADYVPNPSLLDLKNWECRLPLSSIPFNSFAPIKFAATGVHSMHDHCIAILKKQLRAYRSCSDLHKLSFSFHGGGPLILTLHHFPGYSTTRHQDQAASISMPQQGNLGRFDIIHAPTLIDRVGVLNVLLCCGRLLYP